MTLKALLYKKLFLYSSGWNRKIWVNTFVTLVNVVCKQNPKLPVQTVTNDLGIPDIATELYSLKCSWKKCDLCQKVGKAK